MIIVELDLLDGNPSIEVAVADYMKSKRLEKFMEEAVEMMLERDKDKS
jgi:hypothetical protein